MPVQFTGTLEELTAQLAGHLGEGHWTELNANQIQFRHKNGGILNWYVSTGTISFQGSNHGKAELEMIVARELGAAPSLSGVKIDAPPHRPKTAPPDRTPSELPPKPKSTVGLTLLQSGQSDSEVVLGLVGAVGTELKLVVDLLVERLKGVRYETREIKVSREVIPELCDLEETANECQRINSLMNAGNKARQISGDNSVLALGIAAKISAERTKNTHSRLPEPQKRHAYIINSLKHPAEVAKLRDIYPQGFYLIGVHADAKRRHEHLTADLRLSSGEASDVMKRDEDEAIPHGQQTSATFHLSDFFVHIDGNQDRLRGSISRIVDVLFGHPYTTPTFDEYAMFMAFAAALRSADLSRQVGAVVARDNEILSTGANDCPKAGGGLYWPELIDNEIRDATDGRDYMRGEDANKAEQQRIIEDIVNRIGENADKDSLRKALGASRLADITEYGRMVHAEMEAILSLARSNTSARNSTIFCTTFPCHNCAKHIVAAGIIRVVYIEPYPKSKAAEFHSDSITLGFAGGPGTVHFEPFVGVGPRRFFDLFSMRLSTGYALKRKDHRGQTVDYRPEEARLRMQMLPCSYLELELVASELFNEARSRKEATHGSAS